MIEFAASDFGLAMLPRAGQHDIGADREPEGVVAHDWDFDEHAKHSNDHCQEREHKNEVHCAYLLALRRNVQNACSIEHNRQRTRSFRRLKDHVRDTRPDVPVSPPAIRVCFGLECPSGPGNAALYPRTSAASHCLVALKRPSDSGIFEGFSWSVHGRYHFRSAHSSAWIAKIAISAARSGANFGIREALANP